METWGVIGTGMQLDVGIVPPLEPLYEGELSLVQQHIVCGALGCPEDSRHRRRQRLEQAAVTGDGSAGSGL
ncbi:hypothetical protein GCM10022244_29770 [Streptomyces gulbargensis]|uniref:Uncharacterized protein n=2 Tax=Streptomyces gulbargensis TaxID=364901 RepID=A0ABP7MD92_9ACTN